MTAELRRVRYANTCREITLLWKSYHYLRANSKKGVYQLVLNAAPSAYLAGKSSSADILVARPLK